MNAVEKTARTTVDQRLEKKKFKVGDPELEHMANLLLQGSYTKTQGILAPVNTTGLLGCSKRLREDTFDPRIGARREIPFTDYLGGMEQLDGEIDVYADGNGNQYLVINHDDAA